MPVLAACSTCTPLLMPSNRLPMSLARESSDWAVKKLVGLSRAEFTFLPVANRFWVVARRSAVDCSESRFWRTEAESTIPDMGYLSGVNATNAEFSLARCRHLRRCGLKNREVDCWRGYAQPRIGAPGVPHGAAGIVEAPRRRRTIAAPGRAAGAFTNR